jgi:hypothetical protein
MKAYCDELYRRPGGKAVVLGIQTTVGVDYKEKIVNREGRRFKIQIWDTAGQERYRTITRAYYAGAMVILMVYDVMDRASFDALRTWHREIRKHNRTGKLFLIGNKIDMVCPLPEADGEAGGEAGGGAGGEAAGAGGGARGSAGSSEAAAAGVVAGAVQLVAGAEGGSECGGGEGKTEAHRGGQAESTAGREDGGGERGEAGGRCDAGSRMSSSEGRSRQVLRADAVAFAAEHGMGFFETSALSGLNVETAFDAVCDAAVLDLSVGGGSGASGNNVVDLNDHDPLEGGEGGARKGNCGC